MKEVFKKLIMRFISNKSYVGSSKSRLAKDMGISSEDNAAFSAAFDELRNDNQIRIKRGLIGLPKMPSTVTGVFRSTKKGFGFVVPDKLNSSGDLFIPAEHTLNAMDGDIVVAKTRRRSVRGGINRASGEILKILERAKDTFTGTLKKEKGLWIIEPDGKDFKSYVIVDDITAKGAKVDDKVAFDIIEYPSERYPARGVITEVLGKSGQYDAELKAIVRSYSLAGDFSSECIAQARQASKDFANAQSQGEYEDITDELLITIDPPDAKDFDDAISLSKDDDGNYVLGVHIADVSRFIPLDSPLDIEARKRGNSVYLPGKVIPMLPEILSNGICSLQPDQPRYAKSVYITYDTEGKVIATSFANSLIKSKARLSYLQADAAIKGEAGELSAEVVALLKEMDTLARVIEDKRTKEGMLHLDLHETELIMDDDGKVIDAQPAENCYPHTIIEMFMVEANVAVAQMLNNYDIAFIRRVHPDPDPFSVNAVSSFATISGLRVPKSMDRRDIQALLDKVRGSELEYPINKFILRSFEKAHYSPLNMGHYALASRHYCHFTSPIRRYADLTIHRLFQCYIDGKLDKPNVDEVLSEAKLIEIGRNISDCEVKAADAERELKKVLILEMLSEKIGDTMSTVVSGVTKFGVFVQCLKFGIEGLISLEALGNDQWQYQENSQSVVGKLSGKKISLGMAIEVRIVSVNVAGRHLDVAPVEPIVSRDDILKKKKKKSKKLKRKLTKKFRKKSKR